MDSLHNYKVFCQPASLSVSRITQKAAREFPRNFGIGRVDAGKINSGVDFGVICETAS